MKRSILGVATLALALAANSAEAQKPISFGIGLGATMAQGDFGDAVDMGYHALGTLAWAAPALPVGVRFDASYNRLGFKDDVADGETFNILGITANATWGIPMAASPVSPYLIGGLGWYQGSTSIEGSESDSKIGFNVGGGVKFNLSGFGTFIEARYHMIGGDEGEVDTNFIPITFGIMF